MAEFKNPNQQGGQDNHSFLLMMLVMVAVFFGLQYFQSTKPKPASPKAPAAATAQNTPAPANTPAGSQPGTAASTQPAEIGRAHV